LAGLRTASQSILRIWSAAHRFFNERLFDAVYRGISFEADQFLPSGPYSFRTHVTLDLEFS
jgi:hypothetical protein